MLAANATCFAQEEEHLMVPAPNRPAAAPAKPRSSAAAAAVRPARPAARATRGVAPPPRLPPTNSAPASLLHAILNAISDDPDGRRQRARDMQEQNVRNIEPQFRPQFQQLLYTELAFLRRVCKPAAKPFVEVAKAAKADLRLPLRRYVSSIYGMNRVPGDTRAEPRLGIQEMLMPLVEAKLGPEKAALYRQECDKRTEARRHTVVVNLVAALDERLVLTVQQRTKLVQSLSANYENDWDQYLQMLTYRMQFCPSIRDESIVPLLDERQKIVWEQTPKQGRGVFFGPIIQNNVMAQDPEIQEIARIVEEVHDDR